MNERDPIAVLTELDRPAPPRPEFTDALRERLLADLAEHDRQNIVPRRPALRQRPWRRVLLTAALAATVAAVATTVVLLSRPSRASALSVIHQAQRRAAALPAFEATVRFDINRGQTETVAVSYGRRRRVRTQIVSQHPQLDTTRGVGDYDVADGRRSGFYDSKRRVFYSSPISGFFAPLAFLAWHGGYPDWDKVCRGPASRVLPDERVAGRRARHILCSDFTGEAWQLWIDRRTGLLLKLVGRIGSEGDSVLESVPTTSAKGGFTIERLRYNPSFSPGTFKVAGPRGALDVNARLQSAIAGVPPFHAVFSVRSPTGNYVAETWWRNQGSWRRTVLESLRRDLRGGPGSFSVRVDGQTDSYNARDRTFERGGSNPDPIQELLPEADPRYSTAACPTVGHDRIVGRPAVHRRCTAYDVWVDSTTGITLKLHSPGFDFRVRSIAFHPVFPPGTLRFVPPPGSRNADQLTRDPFYKTTLARGKQAPDWTASRFGGGAFRLGDLRGRPALLLLLPDGCTDPACNEYAPLERVYRRSKNITIVWVDFQGSPSQARKIVRVNHLTVPVIDDPQGRSIKAWRIQGYPFWLLLDKHGIVIDARFKQTTAQLRQLLSEAR